MSGFLWCAIGLELLLAASAGLLGRVGTDPGSGHWLLGALLVAFMPYFVAVYYGRGLGWNRIRAWVWVGAVLMRVTMLAAPVVLSDDVYRYQWEGRIQAAGFNPYRFAPDAPELAGLRDANWERVAHQDVSSVYPPLLLGLFRVVARVSDRLAAFRIVFALFDLATIWFLRQLLRARSADESNVLIWAWNPLVILEFAGNAHEMSLSICGLVAGLWLLESAKPGGLRSLGAGAAMAVAVLSQFLAWPLVLAVAAGARIKKAGFWLAFIVLVAAGFAGYADAGRHLWLGLTNFAGRWHFNGSLFGLLAAALRDHGWRQITDDVWLAFPRTKLLVAVVLAGVLALIWARRCRPTLAAFLMAGTVLVLSPTVHPWYLTWVVALACVEFSIAWLVLSGLIILSYTAKLTQWETGVWVESGWIRWLEYVPFFVLLAVEFWRYAHHAKRIIRIGAGFGVLALGLFLMIPGVPGPGIPFVILGLALLAEDFVWAHRLHTWIKAKVSAVVDRLRGRP